MSSIKSPQSFTSPRSAQTSFPSSTKSDKKADNSALSYLTATIVFFSLFGLYCALHAALGSLAILLGLSMIRSSFPSLHQVSPASVALSGAIGGVFSFLVQICTLQFALFDFLYSRMTDETEYRTTAWTALLILYTKIQALVAGLLLGAIGQGLVQPEGMNALQATLASFLGCASFVLANSIAQGLWLWKEGRIGQGCALLLAEFGNPIPHHLDCLLHLWDTRQERSYTYAATSKISSHSFTSKPLQLPQQSVIGSSRHSRNSGTFVVPTSSKKSLSIDTAAVPSPTSARNICLPSPPLQTYIYTTRVR